MVSSSCSRRTLAARAFPRPKLANAGCLPSALWDLLERRLPISSITHLNDALKQLVWSALLERPTDVQLCKLTQNAPRSAHVASQSPLSFGASSHISLRPHCPLRSVTATKQRAKKPKGATQDNKAGPSCMGSAQAVHGAAAQAGHAKQQLLQAVLTPAMFLPHFSRKCSTLHSTLASLMERPGVSASWCATVLCLWHSLQHRIVVTAASWGTVCLCVHAGVPCIPS